MTFEPTSFLRSGYEGLDAHDLLRSPLNVLVGVNPVVIPELKKLGIATVFDLGCSWLFKNARAASAPRDSASPAGRFGVTPNDWLAASSPAAGLDEIPHLAFENLRGLDSVDIEALRSGMAVRTIREFALWPPFQFAYALVSQSYGTADDPDEISSESLRPRFGEYPTERVYYKRLVMLDMGLGDQPLKSLDGPVSLKQAIRAAGGGKLTKPAVGAMVTFSQSWYAQRVTLDHT